MAKLNVEFESGLCPVWSSTLFDDCEVSFDPEFGFVVVESRGYEVIIELGNTSEWILDVRVAALMMLCVS